MNIETADMDDLFKIMIRHKLSLKDLVHLIKVNYEGFSMAPVEATFIEREISLKGENEEFEIEVDNMKPLERIIFEGKFYFVNPNINEKNFYSYPRSNDKIFAKLFDPKELRHDYGSDYKKQMKQRGYVGAELRQLLALNNQGFRFKNDFNIIAPASLFNEKQAPYIGAKGGKRILDLILFDANWSENCRFLGVRK